VNVYVLRLEGIQVFSTARKAVEYLVNGGLCEDAYIHDDSYEEIALADLSVEKMITMINKQRSIEECGGEWAILKESVW